MTSGSMPGAGDAGRVTIVVGVGGCAWELALWLRAVRKRLAAQEHVRARGELKVARTARRLQEQTQERQQKQTHLRAVRQRIQRNQTEHKADKQRLTSLNAQRAKRFQMVLTEAARLQALSDPSFLTEIPSIFAVHGLQLQSGLSGANNGHISKKGDTHKNDADEQSWDMRFMRLADEAFEIARCIPQGHTAAVADVEALEQWRCSCEASHAYLIGRNGFSAAAIRLAQHFPLTLIEPQILAQWHITGKYDQDG